MMKLEINLDTVFVDDGGWEESITNILQQEIKDTLRKMIRNEIKEHSAKLRSETAKAVDAVLKDFKKVEIQKIMEGLQ